MDEYINMHKRYESMVDIEFFSGKNFSEQEIHNVLSYLAEKRNYLRALYAECYRHEYYGGLVMLLRHMPMNEVFDAIGDEPLLEKLFVRYVEDLKPHWAKIPYEVIVHGRQELQSEE